MVFLNIRQIGTINVRQHHIDTTQVSKAPAISRSCACYLLVSIIIRAGLILRIHKTCIYISLIVRILPYSIYRGSDIRV